MLRNLYLAYAVTWVIHGVYFVYLWRKYQRVRREAAALQK
jgi:hypothetical protein